MANNDGQRCHRCTSCQFDWPYQTQYLTCPICDIDTYATTSHEVLTPSQAHAAVVEAEAQISRREEIERKLDEAVVRQALAALDEELGSLLC